MRVKHHKVNILSGKINLFRCFPLCAVRNPPRLFFRLNHLRIVRKRRFDLIELSALRQLDALGLSLESESSLSGELKRIMIKLLSKITVSPMMRQFTLYIICINFQFVFFADNFRECATLNAFHEEIFKLNFILNQGRSNFFKNFIREDAVFCFVI